MKGVIQMLEAIISIALIISVLFFFFYPKSSKVENFYLNGYSCLKDLDDRGLLRYYSQRNLETDLKISLNSCLSPIVFDARICKTADCDVSNLPNKTVTSLTYFLVGDNSFESSEVRLWMWSS